MPRVSKGCGCSEPQTRLSRAVAALSGCRLAMGWVVSDTSIGGGTKEPESAPSLLCTRSRVNSFDDPEEPAGAGR